MVVEQKEFDVVAIGGGPGGKEAGLNARKYGLKTAVIERGNLGGLCANIGCGPVGTMLDLVRVKYNNKNRLAPRDKYTYEEAIKDRDRFIRQASGGFRVKLRKAGADMIKGEARFLNPHQVEIVSGDDRQVVTAKKFVIATGSRARRLPIPGSDLPGVIDYEGALAFLEPPKKVVVIGANKIGIEWANIWNASGSRVTLVDRDDPISNQDPEISELLKKDLASEGIKVKADSDVFAIEQTTRGLLVRYRSGGQIHQISADVVLESGRRLPNIERLNLEAIGVVVNERGIIVNEFMETSTPDIYALGDVVGHDQAAYAITQGQMVVENIMGDKHPFDSSDMPTVVGVNHQAARFGITEEEADSKDRVGRFKSPYFRDSKTTPYIDDTFVKVIISPSGEIRGAHAFGIRALTNVVRADDAVHFYHWKAERIIDSRWQSALKGACLDANGSSLDFPYFVNPTFAPTIMVTSGGELE